MPALCRSMALERVVNIRQGNGEASANHAKQSRRILSHDWISGGKLPIRSFWFSLQLSKYMRKTQQNSENRLNSSLSFTKVKI